MYGNERQSAPDGPDTAGDDKLPPDDGTQARPADAAADSAADDSVTDDTTVDGPPSTAVTPPAAATERPTASSPAAGAPAPDKDTTQVVAPEPGSEPGSGQRVGTAPAEAATPGGSPPTTQATVPPTDRTDSSSGPATTPDPPGPPAYGANRTPPPKIFDLPDETRPGKAGGNGTIVLGGAAAAEGRTTGPNPRIAGPASKTSRQAGAPDEPGAEPTEARGRHFASLGDRAGDRNLWPLGLATIPVVVLVLLVVGWAVDTAALSGQVMRNVEVAGRSVGGLGEASLPEVMDEVNDEVVAQAVVVTSGDRQYETTAGALGLAVDREATADAALDAGRDDPLLTRPVTWLASFFSPRDVPVEYSVSESQVSAEMFELQGAELLAFSDPTIELGEQGSWVAVPGTPGRGIDTDEIVSTLPQRAADAEDGVIEVQADTIEVAPRFTDADAQALAERANAITAEGITLTAGEASVQVGPEVLRTWIGPTTENNELELAIKPEEVNAALPELFPASEPVDASFTLEGGNPVVVPSQQGTTCCGPDSAEVIWQAISADETTAELEVVVTEPAVTTEAAEGLGITQPVGGNNAFRDGSATTAGPGFTTYHAGGQPRVTNIHLMADTVRGSVILPGETFSINELVGPRTAEKGYVAAGAIRDGEHRDEIGGGVSQFATTLFNAAYFAGLDIPVSQAHSEYFSRYPPGREATMGHPNPDLQVTNNTPHGVMIWTSYTDTSLTVTMYSTPYATAEQTGISESMTGACRNVTTTRTRTYPDGTTEDDTFRATYRPGDGETC